MLDWFHLIAGKPGEYIAPEIVRYLLDMEERMKAEPRTENEHKKTS